MHHLMAKFWWILALRGLLGILLGLVSIIWITQLEMPSPDIFGMGLFLRPAAIVATLLLILGIYAFIDGLFALVLGFQNYGEGRHWWSLVLEGLVSLGLGVVAWVAPGTGALALLYWIAGWAIFTGLLEMFQGVELNEYRDRRKPFLIAGIISILFGIIVLAFRVAGVELVWALGAYAFLFGVPLLTLGLRLRHFVKLAQKGA